MYTQMYTPVGECEPPCLADRAAPNEGLGTANRAAVFGESGPLYAIAPHLVAPAGAGFEEVLDGVEGVGGARGLIVGGRGSSGSANTSPR